MTIARFGLAYGKCTFKELKHFVHERRINAKARSRRQIIRELRRADRNATFNFFGLPLELSSMIYKEVCEVEQPEGEGLVYPLRAKQTILRTSRQLYFEARRSNL